MYIKGVTIDWDKISRGSYLRSIPAVSSVNTLFFNKAVTFFVGENGSGKSTIYHRDAFTYPFRDTGCGDIKL